MSNLSVKRLSIGEIDPKLRIEMDLFNEDHFGTIYHETFFNKISSEFFGTHLSYFLAYKNKTLVGIFPCHSKRKGLVINSYSNLTSQDLPYGGWVYDSDLVSLDLLFKHTRLRINEALHISSNIELSTYNPYKPKAIKTIKEAGTVILGLSGRSDEDIFKSFKHSQKNKIRKASKLGVEIKQTGHEGIDEFHELLAELKGSLGKGYPPQEYFGNIFSHYHSKGRAACFLARYKDEDVSTLIMLANKAYATIWFGGRKLGIPNNLYQNELMIWEAIKWARSYGSKYFDLCTVDEERYANLARIKLSFSKDIRTYYFCQVKGIPFRALNRLQDLLS